jgi:hypothetical protein
VPRDPLDTPDAALQPKWLAGLRIYLGVSALANLAWELLQLPLYALWQTGTGRDIAFAVLHCTAGDVLIAALTLLSALLVVGAPTWPIASFGRVAAATILLGIAYTAWSEYLNTGIRGSWRYSELMPVVPPFGTGLAPLAQWLVVPLLCLGLARRTVACRVSRRGESDAEPTSVSAVIGGYGERETGPK